MAKHTNATKVHRINKWVFDDAAAREAGTGYTFTASDVGKLGKQSDDLSYWELIDHSPLTWSLCINPDAPTLTDVSDAAAAALAKSLFGTRIPITGARTVVLTDQGACFDVTANTFSIAFDPAATLGDAFRCAVFNSGSGVVTLDPDGSETIRDQADSATTKTLAQGELMILQCTGTGFNGFKFRNLSNVTNDAQLKAADLDTDGSLTANSDAKIASQKATRTAISSATDTTALGATTHGATGKTTPVDTDEIGLADSAASWVLKKLTWANLKATLKTYFDTLYASTSGGAETVATIGALVNGATAKTTPVDADMVGLMDSAASNVLKKLSWANVKATLKTYFDTLYGAGDMVLSSNQTVTGAKTFNDAKFILAGATSGTTTVKAAAVAGTTTITLPDATDTLIGKATTDTLTNKRVTPRTDTVASSATPAINTDTTDLFTITALAAAITSMTTNLTGTPSNGEMLMIRIKDNGTARAITWGASFASRGATLPTTTVVSKILYVLLIWNSTASTWDCVSTAQEA